ncbi:DUF6712 family protein [Chryseobacterium sp. ZHDP1]|uniref:DUF6712 family protein n=1 Tax=Chryseobacterium sp. ZHDP1 TaxID=2838877 RepID=UPI001BDF907E|nr:DUF6712 family protein [Chryseobacterium sp. ZHDP1]QWA38875.1 hypothetical protein KKI44_01300 [Chryseobacterium sp. ZHDP1]
MEYYIDEITLPEYFILPGEFDWKLIDQELGFSEIFEIIPKEIYLQLKEETEDNKKEIFRLLTKASVLYSFILAIPKIKVHITNYGVQEFIQEKSKSAPWWDVRDLGLSLLKFADKLFSEALTKIAGIEALKNSIPFFENVSENIKTPAEFEEIYSIKNSPKVFKMLQTYLVQAYSLDVLDKIKPDCIEQIKLKPELYKFLKQANICYALYYASLMPNFVFLQNAIVIQYEELPWQKSQVLTPDAKINSGKNFVKLGDASMKVITDFIKKNLSEFPCYSEPVPESKPQSRTSGIYMI